MIHTTCGNKVVRRQRNGFDEWYCAHCDLVVPNNKVEVDDPGEAAHYAGCTGGWGR